MSGYANRVIKIDFPDLSEDWETDPVWVIIRNPKLMPGDEIQSVYSGNTGMDDTGKITDRKAASATGSKLIAKLVVAARVYDAAAPAAFDPLTGELVSGDQPLMPLPPWTPEIAAKLPQEITIKISETFGAAINPPKGSDAPIQKTSSGQPSPSTTAPGPADQAL